MEWIHAKLPIWTFLTHSIVEILTGGHVGSADEHETLLCLRLCTGSEDGARRLVDHPSGLFTVAVCVMSNFRYVSYLLLDTKL